MSINWVDISHVWQHVCTCTFTGRLEVNSSFYCTSFLFSSHSSLSLSVCLSPIPLSLLYLRARLSPSSEARLQLTYKRSIRSSTDPYKRAVYCLLARCDISDNHPDVCVKTEDYMWLKVGPEFVLCIYVLDFILKELWLVPHLSIMKYAVMVYKLNQP